jgi:hypothetical protein
MITMLMALTTSSGHTIYNFDKQSKLENWMIINDVVMGGQSTSSFMLNNQGHGVFRGDISLESNGGFSTLMYRFDSQDISPYSTVAIRLKGDGLRYQFRIKANKYDRETYVYPFQTSGDWEWIEIPLNELYPSWRGRRVSMSSASPVQSMEEISILISNRKSEEFQLELDQIVLR